MWNDLFQSLSLIDKSGVIIIALILITAAIAVILNFSMRRLYRSIERDSRLGEGSSGRARHRFLGSLLKDAEQAVGTTGGDPGLQALIEHHVKRELKGALLAERFLRAAPGLTIVLGLVGTFYGLTLSIGKLVTLITGDVAGAAEITKALTTGLAGALSGMSVAFSTSLFGILASILLVLLNVLSNIPDLRAGVVLRLEVLLDQMRSSRTRGAEDPEFASSPLRTVAAIQTLGASVENLQNAVSAFDTALVGFAKNTRDFQEFNLHLKDNIQRMSLGFGELSDTLKEQVAAMRQGPAR